MSQTASINIKVDPQLKKDMERVCKALGLSMSAAITVYMRKVTSEWRIPFELSTDPFYSEPNIGYVERIVDDFRSGRLNFTEHELIEA